MSWLGKQPELKFTALGRIAFALGAGATHLELVLKKLTKAAHELELSHPKQTIRRWREEGLKMGNAYASPTTEYKITAVYLKAEASYMKWLVKTGADDKQLAEPPAIQSVQRRSTSTTRPRSAKLPLDYGEPSDISSASCQRARRGHPDDDVSEESRTKALRGSHGVTSSGERRLRRVPTPTRVEESELTLIDSQLLLRIPASSSEVYRGRTSVSRLQLTSDDATVNRVLSRLKTSTHNTAVAKSAGTGLLTVHEEIQCIMQLADERRFNELSARADAPPTAGWRLHTSSA